MEAKAHLKYARIAPRKAGIVCDLEPVTREELFLSLISGRAVSTPEPITRIELFLAYIAGVNVELPIPNSRIEIYLHEWALLR